MLIRFNVKNFLSYSDREDNEGNFVSQEFSMLSGKTKLKPEHLYRNNKSFSLLKFAAVYGANASGKSNLIKALRFFRNFVVTGKLPEAARNQFCKSNPKYKNQPSYFEVEFLIGDKIFSYGFEIVLNSGEIYSEWLCELKKNRIIYLLKKEDIDTQYEFGGELADIKDLKILSENFTNGAVLFLHLINNNMENFFKKNENASVLKNAFRWIKNTLDINYPNQPISGNSFLSTETSFDEISQLLSAFGTGIIKVHKENVEVEKVISEMPNNLRRRLLDLINKVGSEASASDVAKTTILIRNRKNIYYLESPHFIGDEKVEAKVIKFDHNFIDNIVSFSMEDESDGTARLFDLLEILLTKKDKVFFIDEIDRCLHPSLTYKFVKTFFEYSAKKNIQLIVTTHESRLLDFDLLRRDEIWFIDKNKEGNSDIYSLEEFNERFDRKIDKAYLEGRYGGVPLFTTIYPIDEE